MATQGVISIVKDNKVLFKCVAGCNAMTAKKTARALKKLENPTIDEVYLVCLKNNFGCNDCTVVQSETEYRQIDMEDGLAPLYIEKFNDPEFNPRWNRGTSSYVEIIKK